MLYFILHTHFYLLTYAVYGEVTPESRNMLRIWRFARQRLPKTHSHVNEYSTEVSVDTGNFEITRRFRYNGYRSPKHELFHVLFSPPGVAVHSWIPEIHIQIKRSRIWETRGQQEIERGVRALLSKSCSMRELSKSTLFNRDDQQIQSSNLEPTIISHATQSKWKYVRKYGDLGGCAIAEVVSRWLPTAAARVRARVWKMGFVVDKVALGKVFSEFFGFPCQKPFIPPTSPSSQSPRAVSRGLATSWSPVQRVLLTA
jgi:hypothetical protein